MEKSIKFKTDGLSLVEVVIAMTLLAIMMTSLVALFTRCAKTYVVASGEENSMKRIKAHIPKILDEIRGATELKSTLGYISPGSPNIEYNYVLGGDTKRVWLTYDSATQEIMRTQYDLDTNDAPITSTKATSTFLTDVDNIGFYLYSKQTVVVEYEISDGLPAPLKYKYNLFYAPELPPSPDEE